MAKLFWSNLIVIKEIQIAINKKDLREEEKLRLLEVVYQTFNLRILEVVLSYLPREEHELFLDKFCQIPHPSGLLDDLKRDIEDIEEKIVSLSNSLGQEVLSQLTDN